MGQGMGQQEMMQQGQAGQSPKGGGDNELMDLVTNLSEGLSMFAEALSGVNPSLGEKAQGISESFKSLISELAGSGASGGPVPMEQGASGAKLSGPQMR